MNFSFSFLQALLYRSIWFVFWCWILGADLALGQITFQNPSFEGVEGQITPPSWTACNGTPDTHTGGLHGVSLLPTDGNSYLGFHHATPETVGQVLSSPLVANATYQFTVDATIAELHGLPTWGNNLGRNPGTFAIFGSFSLCGQDELLWESPLLTDPANVDIWQTFTIQFTPSQPYTHILIVPLNGGVTYFALDNITPIVVVNDTPPILTLSTAQNFCAGSAPLSIATPLTLTDPDGPNLDNATVTINAGYVNGEDVLTFTPQFGITGTFAAATGVLTLSGNATAAQYQTVLQSVQYQNVSATPTAGQRTISFVAGGALFNPANGHFYQLVNIPSGIDWDAANASANANVYFGLQGYLVTITSQAENDFVQSKINANTWMGANDVATNGQWLWVTGPEAGTHFSNQVNFSCNTPVGTGVSVGGNFVNWANNEPNDCINGGQREDYGHLRTDGLWNDFTLSNNNVSFYLVEYGGMPSDPALNIQGQALVTVCIPPTVTVSNSTPTTICAGGSSTVTVAGASTYVWNPTLLTGETQTFSPATTTTFTVTGTDANGCTDTETITITVNPLPTVSASATATSVCAGGSTDLTGAGAATYTWSPATDLSANTGTTVTATPTATRTYTVTGTDANGCSNTATITITRNALPTVSASASVSTLCVGQSSTLTGSGATTYLWQPGALAGTSVAVFPATTTTYTVTGTDANGCTNTATVTVNVSIPVVTVAPPSAITCTNTSTTLTASGATTYNWVPGNLTGTSVTVSPLVTTTYTVTGTNNFGCTDTETVTVTVNTVPTVTATATPASYCSGGSSTLNANGAISYVWQPGNLLGATQTVSPLITTTFTVTGTDANGCTGTTTQTVIVNNLPFMTVSGPTTICQGQSGLLSVSGAANYVWQPGSLTGSSQILSPANTTTFTITGTTATGCVDSIFYTLNVNTFPVVTISTTSDSICFGGNTNLTATNAQSYVWAPTGQVGATINVNPTVTTLYTVTGTVAGGCTDTETILIEVLPLPTVFITSNATNNAICQNNSIVLTANGTATSYEWFESNLANSISTNPVSVTVSPLSTTNYFLVGTDANGCQQIDQMTVTVNPLPSINIGVSGTNTICSNETATLTASGATSYVWAPGGQTGSSITVSPGVTTIFTVTGTDGNACVNTATFTVNVNPVPNVSIAVTNNNFCAGTNTTTLTASGANSYVWNTGATTPSITVNNLNFTTVFTVTGTGANGCITTASQTITVNSLPTVTVTSNDPSPCAGQPVTLTASGAVNYFWSTGQSGASITVSPNVTTTYVVSGTDGNGCVRSAIFTVTPDPLPVINLVTSAGTICPGETVTLTAASSAGNFLWNTGSTLNQIVVNPLVTTTFDVFSVDPITGCSNTVSRTITVLPAPAITATVALSPVCSGSVTTLTATGGVAYVWSNGLTGANIQVAPLVTTTFTVTGTGANGCTSTAAVAVVANPLPIMSLTASNTTVCANDPVTLFASGANTYLWNTGDTGANLTVNPAVTTNYSVIGTDVNGCTNMINIIINVNPLPPVQMAATSTDICEGQTVTLSAEGASSYVWDTGQTGDNILVSPLATTTYTVTGTDANGCSRQSSLTITVRPLPTNAFPTNDSPVCAGDNVNLSLTQTANVSYLWFGPNGFLSTLPNPVLANVSTAAEGVYTVISTLNGCSNAGEQTFVDVDAIPAAGAPTSNSALCTGQTLQLSTPFVTGGVYDWIGPNGFTSTLQNPSIANVSLNEAGTYTVRVGVNGCFGAFGSTDVVVFDTPVADISTTDPTIFCAGGSALLQATPLTNHTYVWLLNNVAQNVPSTQSTFIATQTGTYTCIITSPNNCSVLSSSIDIIANPAPTQTAAITVQGSATVCDGNTVLLTAPFVNGFGYQWFDNGSAVAGATTNILGVTTGGTYTLEVTNGSGCTATAAPVVVTVNPLPTVNVSASGATTFCNGQSVVLSATVSSGFTYQWRLNGSDLLGQNLSDLTATASGDYTVLVTDGNGCTVVSSVTTVTVLPLVDPALSLSGTTTLCPGGSVTISVTNPAVGSTYQWRLDGATLAGETNSFITANATGSYFVEITGVNGCVVTSALVPIVVEAPFVPTILATGTLSTICQGQTATLNASGGVGFQYQWYKDGVIQIGLITQSIDVTQAGDYSVEVTNQNGCKGTSLIFPVTVLPLPDASVTSSISDFTFCPGQTITLTAPQTAGLVYQWRLNGVDIFGATGSVFDVTAQGSYSVVVTDQNGCSAVSTPLVYTQLTPPSAVVNTVGSTTFCEGGSVLLQAPAGTGFTYQWFLEGQPIVGEVNVNLQVVASGNYTVLVTGANGCSSLSEVVPVAVNPLPTGSFTVSTNTGSTNFCSNQSIILSTTEIPSFTYQWLLFGNTIAGATANSFETVTEGIYLVRLTNEFGCSVLSDPITITALPAPAQPIITLQGNPTLCAGNSLVLTAFSNETVAFQWLFNGQPLTGETNANFTATAAGYYSVLATNAGGCTVESDSVQIQLLALPDVTLSLSGNLIQCAGDSLTLSVPEILGVTYQWSKDGVVIVGESRDSITVTESGAYSVLVTGANGCSATSLTADVQFLPVPVLAIVPATDTVFCTGSSVVFNVLPADSSLSYQWLKDGQPVANANGLDFLATQSGVYSVVAANAGGCSDTSNTKTVHVIPPPNATIIDVVRPCGTDTALVSVALFGAPPYTLTYLVNDSTFVQDSLSADTVTLKIPTADFVTLQMVSVFSFCGTVALTEAIALDPIVTGITLNSDTTLCAGNSGTIDATFGGYAPFTVIVRKDGSQIFADTLANNSLTLTDLSTGFYQIILADSCGNVVSRNFNLVTDRSIFADATANADTVYAQTSVQFNAITTGATGFFWLMEGDTVTGANPIRPFNTVGRHVVYLVAYNAKGCVAIDSVVLYVKYRPTLAELPINNGFSPNDDGINDTWVVIPDIQALYPSAEVTIFNRWGAVVYQRRAYNNDWDGGNLPDGVYYFVLDTKTKGNAIVRGSVTILR